MFVRIRSLLTSSMPALWGDCMCLMPAASVSVGASMTVIFIDVL